LLVTLEYINDARSHERIKKIHLLLRSACAVFPLLRPTKYSLGI